MADYCNITTDLQRFVSNLEDYQDKDIIENWVSTSGSVYEVTGTGFVSAVFEDGTMYVVKTSIAEVEATASTFWYDGATDKLYIQTSGSDTPNSNYVITVGEDWEALKTVMRDRAQDDVDSYMSPMYQTPLMPRSIQVHNTDDFDSIIVEATALITCSKIVNRQDPVKGKELFDLAVNFDDELPKGLLNQLIDGDRALRDQITVKEVGSYNIRAFNASNSSTIEPVLSGIYTGSVYQIVRLQIDTSGAPGTATWKLSDDGGVTFEPTLQKTFDENGGNRRMSILSGIKAYFPTTYAAGDYWDIECFPLTDTAVGAKVGNITMTRRC